MLVIPDALALYGALLAPIRDAPTGSVLGLHLLAIEIGALLDQSARISNTSSRERTIHSAYGWAPPKRMRLGVDVIPEHHRILRHLECGGHEVKTDVVFLSGTHDV
jgi:hypothetical protein